MPPKAKRQRVKLPSLQEQELLKNAKAFEYLPKIRDASYDFSSADVYPERPMHLLRVYRPRDIEFQDAVMSKDAAHPRGSVKFLKACADFFVRHGFDSETLYRYSGPEDKREEFVNISATPGVLKSIEIIYNTICQAYHEEDSELDGAAAAADAAETQEGLKKFCFDKSQNIITVFAPTFGYYLSQIIAKEMKYSIFETKEECGFLPDLVDLEEFEKSLQYFKVKPKVFLLCYPNNPTGAVMTREVAEKLLEIARKHNILIISDEVYIDNDLYDKKKSHFSIGSLPGALSNVITLTNLSKSSGLAGIETGMVVGDSHIIKIFNNFQGYRGVEQLVIEKAIADNGETRDYHSRVQRGYQANITNLNDRFLPELNDKLSGIFQCEINIKPKIKEPKYGNIYLLDFSDLKGKVFQGKVLETGLDISEFLYETASIAVVPGECFLFKPEEMIVRMSLGHEKEKFKAAFANLNKSLDEYIEKQASFDMDVDHEVEAAVEEPAAAAAAAAAAVEKTPDSATRLRRDPCRLLLGRKSDVFK